MCGGGAPAPVIQQPPPPPKPTYTADDGSVFDDMGAYNNYQTGLRRSKFETGLNSAYNKTKQDSLDYFANKGVDGSQYENDILSSLDKMKQGVPDLDANPASYFRNAGEELFNRYTTRDRTNFTNKFQGQFGSNYADTVFGGTADDSLLDQIYAEKYQPASAFLTNALSRGQLTSAGYEFANKNLANQATAAKSRLQSMGGDVLNTYRTGVRNLQDQANSAINSYQLGQQFNVDDWINQLTSKTNEYKSKMEGDIRGAIGSQELFDVQSLLNQAAAFGGATNAQGDLTAAIMESEKKKNEQRGTGTTGVF